MDAQSEGVVYQYGEEDEEEEEPAENAEYGDESSEELEGPMEAAPVGKSAASN